MIDIVVTIPKKEYENVVRQRVAYGKDFAINGGEVIRKIVKRKTAYIANISKKRGACF